ncbi:hypothetical protein ACRALDRAFT_2103461, partial [Sodiomyces alcalophilus JCM 7366]|uniref:uncharacterized protein n=1 Tax=Sodiomyces alcalophilus JCM 7366 TaxID=591952 RepID=UPI0039B43DA9
HAVWHEGKRRAYCEDDCEKQLAREAAIYKHLGEHARILRYYGLREIHAGIHALCMEYAPFGDVRTFLQANTEKAGQLSEHIRLQMALDAALGISYIHARGVVHGDMSCRNLFLFENYRVKIGDFGGSWIEGSDFKMCTWEEPAYELPLRGREFEGRPARKRELFGLGSAIYEMLVGVYPHEGLDDDEIEQKFAAEEFPSLDRVAAGDIIQKCWDEKFEAQTRWW